MRRLNSKRSEAFLPRSVKKLLNIRNDVDEFSADEDEDLDHQVAGKRPFRRYSDSGLCRTHFTYSQDLSIFVGTWNVAGRTPPQNLELSEWLDASKHIDIYVLGFQEIVPLNPGNVLGAEDEGPAVKWESLIRQTLNGRVSMSKSTPTSPWREDAEEALKNKDSSMHKKARSIPELSSGPGALALDKPSCNSYIRIISKQMVGIFITVWIRKALRRYVHDVKVSCVGCGLMGYYGNKGSISVSMMVDQTSFCFICTHLTSGEKEGDELRRNSDVDDILKRTSFSKGPGEECPEKILSHDRLVWLGDLNYRLSLPYPDVMALLSKKDWEALQERDQLKAERCVGGVFQGWLEGPIEFPPTYKYKVNTNEYSSGGEKQRTPAWCDRILWQGSRMRLVDYFRSEYTISDHRPVAAILVAEVEILKRRGAVHGEYESSLWMSKLRSSNKQQEQLGFPAPKYGYVKMLLDSSAVLPL